MSRERLEWTLALLDRASGPARRVARGLDAVREAQERVKKAGASGGGDPLDALSRASGARRTASRARLGKELDGFAAAQRRLNGSTRDWGAIGASAFMAAGAAALTAAAAVGRITLALGQSMVEAADWRNRTEGAFRVLLRGDQSLGGVEGAFQRASQYANRFGLDVRDVARQMTQLTAAGFSQREIPIFMQAAGDLGALEGPQAAERAITAIRQIRSKGVTQMEEIRGQLSDAGFNVGDFVAEIGRARGLRGNAAAVSRQVEALMTARRIDSNEGSQAFLRVMQARSGGRLGATLDTQSHGAGAAMNRLNNAWLLLQSNFARSNAFTRIIGFIERLATAFDPASERGNRMSAMLDRLFGYITGPLEGADAGGAIDSLMNAFDRGAAIFNTIAPLANAFYQGFFAPIRATVGALVPQIKEFFGTIFNTGGPSLETLRGIGNVFGFFASVGIGAIGGLVAGLGLLARVLMVPLSILSGFWRAFIGAFSGVELTFSGIGGAIVRGLWSGLQAAWSRFTEQFRSLVSMLPVEVKNLLGIHSPSRVFARLGGHVAAGFALGIESGTGNVLGAVGAMVNAPDVGGVGARAAARARAGGVNIGSFAVSVQLVAPDGTDGEALGVAIASVVRREFEAPLRPAVGG